MLKNKKSITMKLLQNNFTSPEQSRRLLDLGLPADSADCYWHFIRRNEHALLRTELRWLEPSYVDKYTAFVDMAVGHDKYRANRLKTYLPCWSVGRLIEIELMCREKRAGQIARLYFTAEDNLIDADTIGQSNITESLIRYMESALYNYDFSKLEE